MNGVPKTIDFDHATLAAYERWAPSYRPSAHNPLMRAEEAVMREFWPDMAGKRVLDLACGTGRYTKLIANSNPAQLVALDLCEPMLARVRTAQRIRASMMSLPFAARVFDVLVCGLAIGHASDVGAWMSEVERVMAPGAVLLYSDFHPAAAAAGLPRSFKDEQGMVTIVPHCVHTWEQQCQAAAAAGLRIEMVHEVRVGIELTESFPRSAEFYERWHGLPLVLIARVHK